MNEPVPNNSQQFEMPPPWRLVGRANPFVPWIFLGNEHRLEQACKNAEKIKAEGKFYVVHVRAN